MYLLWLPEVTTLHKANPIPTALMKMRGDASLLLRWVPLALIPLHVRQAVIIAEDGSFYSHNGIDLEAIWTALKESVTHLKAPRGASTITQQVAKNVFLSQSYNPLRKIKEILIARRLERALSKGRILEIYLNIIEWGPHIYGISAASEHYFKKSPSQLTLEQAAFLSAIIPSPLGRYDPRLHPRLVQKRKQVILKRLATRGFHNDSVVE